MRQPPPSLSLPSCCPLPPPSRTKWTRLVHPSVLIGHVSRARRETRCGARTLRRTHPAAASSRRVLGGGRRAHGGGAVLFWDGSRSISGERAGQTEHRDGVEVRWAVAALASQLPIEAAHHLRTKDPRAQPAGPPPPCVQGVRVRAPRRARRRGSSKEASAMMGHAGRSRGAPSKKGAGTCSKRFLACSQSSRRRVTWSAGGWGRGTQPPCSRDSQQDSMPSALVRERGAL